MCGLLRLEHELELLLKLTGSGLRQKLEDLVLYLNRLKESADKQKEAQRARYEEDEDGRQSLSTTMSIVVRRAIDFMKNQDDKSESTNDSHQERKGNVQVDNNKRTSDISQQRSSAHVSSFSHHSISQFAPPPISGNEAVGGTGVIPQPEQFLSTSFSARVHEQAGEQLYNQYRERLESGSSSLMGVQNPTVRSTTVSYISANIMLICVCSVGV